MKKINSNYHPSHTARGLKLACLLFVFSAGAMPATAQLNKEEYKTLADDLQNGAGPHPFELALLGIESDCRAAPDTVKSATIVQVIQLVAIILSTRDLTVPVDRSVGRWPLYQGTEFGGKPLFIPTNPDTIADPRVKAGYIKALAEHEILLGRIHIENEKIAAVDYGIGFAKRVIDASKNKDTLMKGVAGMIDSLTADGWVKEYVRSALFSQTGQSTSSCNKAQEIAEHGTPLKQETTVYYSTLALALRKPGQPAGVITPFVTEFDKRLSGTINKPPTMPLEDLKFLPADVLERDILTPLGATLHRTQSGNVLAIGDRESKLVEMRTNQVKKGSYTGFDLLKAALADVKDTSVCCAILGGQRLPKTIELKDDLPAQSLGEMMFFMTGELGGNFWSISPCEMNLPQASDNKPKPIMITPFVLLVFPPGN